MSGWAEAIAVAAAAFAGWQGLEAQKARRISAEAKVTADKALALSEAQDAREAVKWKPELHPQHKSRVLFRNVGHSTAFRAVVDASDLFGVRTWRPSMEFEVEPGETVTLKVMSPLDLKDLPDSVKLTYRLEEYGKTTHSAVVPLIEHHQEFRRRSAEWQREHVDQPAEMRLRMKALDEQIQRHAAQAEQPDGPRSAGTSAPSSATPPPPPDADAPPETELEG